MVINVQSITHVKKNYNFTRVWQPYSNERMKYAAVHFPSNDSIIHVLSDFFVQPILLRCYLSFLKRSTTSFWALLLPLLSFIFLQPSLAFFDFPTTPESLLTLLSGCQIQFCKKLFWDIHRKWSTHLVGPVCCHKKSIHTRRANQI